MSVLILCAAIGLAAGVISAALNLFILSGPGKPYHPPPATETRWLTDAETRITYLVDKHRFTAGTAANHVKLCDGCAQCSERHAFVVKNDLGDLDRILDGGPAYWVYPSQTGETDGRA